MTVINSNVAATITANALTKNERAMSQAMERLLTVSVSTVPVMTLRVLQYRAG